MSLFISLTIISLFMIIICIVIGCLIWYKLGNEDLGEVVSVIGAIIFGIFMLTFLTMSFTYYSCKYKATIINNQYGTNYTANELFWGGKTIEKIIRTKEDLLDSNNKIQLELNKDIEIKKKDK